MCGDFSLSGSGCLSGAICSCYLMPGLAGPLDQALHAVSGYLFLFDEVAEALRVVGASCRPQEKHITRCPELIKSCFLPFTESQEMFNDLPVLIDIDQAEPLGGLFRITASAGVPISTCALALSFRLAMRATIRVNVARSGRGADRALKVTACTQNGTNIAGAGTSRGAGTHFAHSVTILLSGIDRFVGPESVQSGRVMFM